MSCCHQVLFWNTCIPCAQVGWRRHLKLRMAMPGVLVIVLPELDKETGQTAGHKKGAWSQVICAPSGSVLKENILVFSNNTFSICQNLIWSSLPLTDLPNFLWRFMMSGQEIPVLWRKVFQKCQVLLSSSIMIIYCYSYPLIFVTWFSDLFIQNPKLFHLQLLSFVYWMSRKYCLSSISPSWMWILVSEPN